MYTKQLLEDVNYIVNPSFMKQLNFDKLNEAIENGLEIELISLLTEDAEENTLKTRLSRIMGKSKIPAATLGLIMLATGVASACGNSEGTTLKTRCFTPSAVEKIKDEQAKLDKIAMKEDENLTIKKISFADYSNKSKRSFPVSGEYKGQKWNSRSDKMSLVSITTANGDTYVGVLDTFEPDKKMLIVNSEYDGRFHVLLNKPHVNSKGVKLAWKPVSYQFMKSAGPVTKLYLGMAKQINGERGKNETKDTR